MINLSENEILIIRDALIEYYQTSIKFSKNEKLKNEVNCLKIDFKNRIK